MAMRIRPLVMVTTTALAIGACGSGGPDQTAVSSFCDAVDQWFSPIEGESVHEVAEVMHRRTGSLEAVTPTELAEDVSVFTEATLDMLDRAVELEESGSASMPSDPFFRPHNEAGAGGEKGFSYSPNRDMYEEPEQRRAVTSVGERCQDDSE